jgi:4-diphosphocytidyl-2-C-methyl-D-erythritol kinase
VVTFPNCKINIGLQVTAKRADGYHNLETIFYPIHGLHDALEIIPAETYSLTISGISIQGNTSDNLITKAYYLLQQQYQLPLISVELLKAIPTGAGLGGGSANATFMLMLLNNYFKLQLTDTQLLAYALQLGSDCPFFVYNTACFASGRGEVLEQLDISLAGKYIYLVKPPVHVSTAQAFSGIRPQASKYSLAQLIHQPIQLWQQHISNDFEQTVFTQHPQLASAKAQLIDAGAVFASMSGTGSTVYGIFDTQPSELPWPADYFSKVLPLG